MKKIIILVLLAMLLISTFSYADGDYDVERTMEKGIVLAIEEEDSDHSFITKIQYVTIEISTGDEKGKIIKVENVISDSYVMDINVEVGQKVLLTVERYPDGTTEYYITSEVRDTYIYGLVIAFMLVLLIVGRMQGLKTIFTLFVTLFFVFMVELPLLLRGFNAVLVTVVVAIFITVITVSVISGLTKKSVSAIVGTTIGVIIAGGLAILVSKQVELTGLSMEEAVMLMNVEGVTLNFQHLLFSAILLGALGAVMDVAMSIASSIDELHRVNSSLSKADLFKSGMRVGRDVMGTMSNTLILAYTGAMLPMLLLFMANSDSIIRWLNLDIIATEVIRAVAGSIGIVLTIPVTAVLSVFLLKDYNKSVK